MHSIRIHKVINQFISILYWTGIWYRGEVPTVREFRIRLFYCFFHFLFVASLAIGAITNENPDESIFLTEITIAQSVLSVKLWIVIWKQKQTMQLLSRICIFSIQNDDDLSFYERKMEKFIKLVVAFICSAFFVYICVVGIVPFVGAERKLIVNIAFPLDYGNNEIAFWIAHIFVATESFLAIIILSTSTVIWYIMFHCSLRYGILGSDMRNMGRVIGNEKESPTEQYKKYFQDLTLSIDVHLHLKELINEMATFATNLFLIQFATSAICICGSIYCLAFNIGVNVVERMIHLYTLFYNIAEIFVITYFGNEIMLSSGGLTYCLFQSDWIEQPQSTKKSIIIFAEYLKRPQVLMIGKLYPLTLETFTKTLNSAYSLFNILKNTKH